MYVSLVKPTDLSPIELDHFLENGWFRIGNGVFTTFFLTFQDKFYNATWLRIDLENICFSKSQKTVLKKAQSFRIEVTPFELTEEKAELFLLYRNSVPFQTAKSLSNLLSYDKSKDVFNTYNVCVYDEDKLIACGIFDLGYKSAQGIVSFFAPDYKKFSLGKLLVLQKILFCKENNYRWFYPGYIAPGYDRFNYKLDMGHENTEYFNMQHSFWEPVSEIDSTCQPLELMEQSLLALKKLIHFENPENFQLLKYKFYDIGLDEDYTNYNLLTYPFFIHCFSHSSLEEIIIVFNIFSQRYELWICHKVFKVKMDPQQGFYTEFLLKPIAIIAHHYNAESFYKRINAILFLEKDTGVSRE